MENGRSKMLSYAPKSSAHKNDCPRISMLDGKNRNMAYRMGICSKAGRQPARGLTPVLRYSHGLLLACHRIVFVFGVEDCVNLGLSTRIFAEDMKFFRLPETRQV